MRRYGVGNHPIPAAYLFDSRRLNIVPSDCAG